MHIFSYRSVPSPSILSIIAGIKRPIVVSDTLSDRLKLDSKPHTIHVDYLTENGLSRCEIEHIVESIKWPSMQSDKFCAIKKNIVYIFDQEEFLRICYELSMCEVV